MSEQPRHPDLYWAAGFLEGEGSFVFNRSDGSVRIDAGQKDREPLERLQTILGGGVHWGGGIFRWRTTGKHAEREALMRMLYPLMSKRRQGQIDAALAQHDAYAGSPTQLRRNAERAKKARKRYRTDPEYRQRRLANQRAWAKRNPAYKKEWKERTANG